MRTKLVTAAVAVIMLVTIAVLSGEALSERPTVYCILPGDFFDASSKDRAAWDALPESPDCPPGAKVNTNP
ncbi:MAG: hypothetical protein M3O29_02645 [Actinomycetota bacterium]|nr:hypothetical protein [Actinomycetota bacterium]